MSIHWFYVLSCRTAEPPGAGSFHTPESEGASGVKSRAARHPWLMLGVSRVQPVLSAWLPGPRVKTPSPTALSKVHAEQ